MLPLLRAPTGAPMRPSHQEIIDTAQAGGAGRLVYDLTSGSARSRDSAMRFAACRSMAWQSVCCSTSRTRGASQSRPRRGGVSGRGAPIPLFRAASFISPSAECSRGCCADHSQRRVISRNLSAIRSQSRESHQIRSAEAADYGELNFPQ